MSEQCQHDWERQDNGDDICIECGVVREFDGDMDDGRDFTPPYEP